MIRFGALTPWIGDGTPWDGVPGNDNAYRPQIVDDYDLDSWGDMTGQRSENTMPSPNLLYGEGTCEDAVFAALDADSTYQVLWSEVMA